METEVGDFISMSLISQYIFTSVAINSISRSLQYEVCRGLPRVSWEVIKYLAVHWYLEVFIIYRTGRTIYGETTSSLINSNLHPSKAYDQLLGL